MNCKAANIIFSRLDIPRYAGVVGTCTLTLTSLLLASVMMVSKRPSVNNTRWLCELWDTWGPYRSWNRDVISSHLVTNRDHVPLRNSNHITLSEHCLFHSFFIFFFLSDFKKETKNWIQRYDSTHLVLEKLLISSWRKPRNWNARLLLAKATPNCTSNKQIYTSCKLDNS